MNKKILPVNVLNKYSWLKERDQEMVLHNDLDGILTGLFFNHYLGWKVVGIYDLEKLSLSESFKGTPKDIAYVDLDVTYKQFKSIGHHIVSKEGENHLNINVLFEVDDKKYRNKFPLSTALFLYWLYEKELPKETLPLLFLIHADSTWKNYKEYKSNVIQWLNKLGMSNFVKFLNNQDVIPAIEKYVIPNTVGWNNQCNFLVKNGKLEFKESNKNVQEYIDSLAKVFQFNPMKIPTDLTRVKTFKRAQVEIPDRNFNEVLTNLKQEKEIFSYSLKYWNKLDLSYIS